MWIQGILPSSAYPDFPDVSKGFPDFIRDFPDLDHFWVV